jgi:hypothetical protein
VQCLTPDERAVRVFGIGGSVLTRLVPIAVVRDVLAGAGVVSRTRRTSAVAGVYLVLALTLFPEVSVLGVFEKLAGVWGRPGAGVPSASSWKQRRAAVGVEPLRLLFGRLRSAAVEVPGARWAGLLVCAWDGTVLAAPDTVANGAAFGKKSNQHGPGAFPLVRLLVLVACGSRAVIDAVFDGMEAGENTLAARLVGALRPGMLLLADRLFPGYALWCRAAGTGAQLCWRVQSNVALPVHRVLPDGSGLAWWRPSRSMRAADKAGLPERVLVRVVSGWITVIHEDGARHSEPYRLVTTLLDHASHPAGDLVRLYGRRWQVELTIKGLKCVQGAARLRSKTPAGVRQEVWAWLCTHQLLRLEAARAAAEAGGPGPAEVRQISLVTLVQRLRDAVIYTGRHRGSGPQVLADLRAATAEDVTPIDTRIRIYPRVVKRPVAKWASKKPHHRGRAAAYEFTITTTAIDAHGRPSNPAEAPTSANSQPPTPALTKINP